MRGHGEVVGVGEAEHSGCERTQLEALRQFGDPVPAPESVPERVRSRLGIDGWEGAKAIRGGEAGWTDLWSLLPCKARAIAWLNVETHRNQVIHPEERLELDNHENL